MSRVDVCMFIATVTPFLVVFVPASCWADFSGVPVGHVPPATVTHVRVCKPFVVVFGVVVWYTPYCISSCFWWLNSILWLVFIESFPSMSSTFTPSTAPTSSACMCWRGNICCGRCGIVGENNSVRGGVYGFLAPRLRYILVGTGGGAAHVCGALYAVLATVWCGGNFC